jgi:hypothetical protein
MPAGAIASQRMWRRDPVKAEETEMRNGWYCLTDLPNRDEAPASKPFGLARDDDELVLSARARGSETIVDPHDPSRYWDYFGGTD